MAMVAELGVPTVYPVPGAIVTVRAPPDGLLMRLVGIWIVSDAEDVNVMVSPAVVPYPPNHA